jgi:hypothetical protein
MVGVVSVLSAFAGEAAAQDYPVRLVSRPQTIPARTLRLDGDFNVLNAGTTSTFLNLGGAYGVIDNLEVGATVAPLRLTENFAYGRPVIYGRYQFIRDGQLQVSGFASVAIPVRGEDKLGFSVGASVWYNFNDQLQLQTGLFYDAKLTETITHALSVPVRGNYNLSDDFHLALVTGITLPLKDTGDTLSVPLGVDAGYVLAGMNNHPLVDVVASFSFPYFLTPGATNAVITDFWQVGIAGRFYLFM